MKKTIAKIRMFEGLPVRDAEEPITLHVLPNDIKKSSKKDPTNCAAARAGQRELGKDVRVFLTRTFVKQKDHWTRYVTSARVAKEIVSFDRGAQFMPGEYNFGRITESQKSGIKRSTKGGPKKDNKNRKKRGYHTTALVRKRVKYDDQSINLIKNKK